VEDRAERLCRNVRSVSFAFSTSPGNTSHISIAQLVKIMGGQPRDLRVVINPSGSATVARVAGRHVDVGITSTSTMQPMVDAGRAAFLGVAGPSRLAALPEIPTFRERGFDVDATSCYVVCAAKDITQEQAAFWERVFADIMAGEEAKEIATRLSWNIEVVPAAELGAFFDQEWDSQQRALIDLGLLRQ
jgi:putative tricarboxylic transport membrane protein